ncbi:Longitudinals lacking protein-like protein, partial [Operophtera brumata]
MGDQQFFLKWNDFQTNMVTSFRHLRDEKSFTDDVSYLHLQAILEFMYAGEVNVSQEQLPAFLKTAARLK